MSGDVVNLRRARKARERAERDKTAAEHRTLFGRTRIERETSQSDRERAAHHLDNHRRIERADEPEPR